mgnify:CR=1 FL=1
MNTPFENNTIYTINDKFYLNINGTTAINLSDDLQQYKAKYPNIEDNKLGLFIEINENGKAIAIEKIFYPGLKKGV